MGRLVGQAFWLSLPVALTGILHMVVVKAKLFESLAKPIDGGATLGGERVFGDNKTWRGVIFMIVGAAALGAIQGLFAGGVLRTVELNAVLGLGYALGELPNSFLKRRLKITPGKTGSGVLGAFFFLLDQADSVVAALILGQLVFGFGWNLVLVGSICLTLLHLLINASLYFARVRKNL